MSDLEQDDYARPRVTGIGARPLVQHAALQHYTDDAAYIAGLRAAQDLTPVDREAGEEDEE